MGTLMARITPCLWFDGRAGEAAAFYTELFPDSSIEQIVSGQPGGDTWPNGQDNVFMAHITVAGQPMQLLNGGPEFPFTEAISFVYSCHGQTELDLFWDALIADGGEESRCGWLRDRFGLSWQIIPSNMGELLVNQGAIEAMYTMNRIDIDALAAARDAHTGD
jgi:predicted 3-demethylubiquinone-9 3-methyltransferase (glyoxalase superfamily)